jgi:arsenite-transporting ATPase
LRLVLYTGKGGVGKTTIAAATAVRAAERGCRTLVVSADAAHSLGDVLDRRLGAAPLELAPHLHALEIDARAELERHSGSIRSFLVSLFVHQGLEAVVAEELALLPGADELMTLLAVEELAASNTYDLVVLDCAPTDAALRLVTLPDVAHRSLRVLLPLFEAISGVAVPVVRKLLAAPLPGAEVFGEADELLNRRLRALQTRVRDESTSVRLVVTPERMVIDEARRAWTELALFEVGCDAVVLNRRLPPEAAGEEWFAERARLEEERQREVEALFAPHPVLVAALQQDEATGLGRLSELGAQLFRGLEPARSLRLTLLPFHPWEDTPARPHPVQIVAPALLCGPLNRRRRPEFSLGPVGNSARAGTSVSPESTALRREPARSLLRFSATVLCGAVFDFAVPARPARGDNRTAHTAKKLRLGRKSAAKPSSRRNSRCSPR